MQHFCYTYLMRIVKVTHDGCIQLTPQDLAELGIKPGDEYILEKQGDVLIFTPLNLVPAQEWTRDPDQQVLIYNEPLPRQKVSIVRTWVPKRVFVRYYFRTSAYSTTRQKGGDIHEAFHEYRETYCIHIKEGCTRIQNNQTKEAEKDREVSIRDTEEPEPLTAYNLERIFIRAQDEQDHWRTFNCCEASDRQFDTWIDGQKKNPLAYLVGFC